MELRVILYEVEAGVAVVTLNRPDRLNAWTTRMEDEYRWCLGTADRDPEVRVIVLTGAGRGFCAGADARALEVIVSEGDYDRAAGSRSVAVPSGPAPHPGLGEPFTFPLGLAKPVLGAINGAAAGVGFVLACACDIRWASSNALFTTSFGRLGLPAEWGVGWLLPRLVGAARAADLLLTSRRVGAEEALAMGLVTKVVPPDDLLPVTLELARAMAAELSPRALRVMKRQLWGGLLDTDLASASAEARELMVAMTTEADFVEGTAALVERRTPEFRAPEPYGEQ
jgi:enoyl-CoA hydratase/carnithine racemase